MPQVPLSVPLVMGTAELGREAQRSHVAKVWVVEPPIDVEGDNPSIDGGQFRAQHQVSDDELLVASVSRLALDLKLDSLVRAIDAADLLATRYKLRLILVGDGCARDALADRAGAVNTRHGREVISLPGAMLDPRAAYAAADVVVAMGSSAMRAMAIGRPLIVQGELGFSRIFEPASYDYFLDEGFYGLADNAPGGARLAEQIESLLVDSPRRTALGAFGHKVVSERFSLQRAADIHLDIYREITAAPPPRNVGDALRSARLAMMVEVANHDPRRKAARRRRESIALEAVRSGPWPPLSGY
jgi:glycosyltransferase involved in cell wall biosynthesis